MARFYDPNQRPLDFGYGPIGRGGGDSGPDPLSLEKLREMRREKAAKTSATEAASITKYDRTVSDAGETTDTPTGETFFDENRYAKVLEEKGYTDLANQHREHTQKIQKSNDELYRLNKERDLYDFSVKSKTLVSAYDYARATGDKNEAMNLVNTILPEGQKVHRIDISPNREEVSFYSEDEKKPMIINKNFIKELNVKEETKLTQHNEMRKFWAMYDLQVDKVKKQSKYKLASPEEVERLGVPEINSFIANMSKEVKPLYENLDIKDKLGVAADWINRTRQLQSKYPNTNIAELKNKAFTEVWEGVKPAADETTLRKYTPFVSNYSTPPKYERTQEIKDLYTATDDENVPETAKLPTGLTPELMKATKKALKDAGLDDSDSEVIRRYSLKIKERGVKP